MPRHAYPRTALMPMVPNPMLRPWLAMGFALMVAGCGPRLAERTDTLDGPMGALLNRHPQNVFEKHVPVEVFASGLSQPAGLTADAESLYWVDVSAGRLLQRSHRGGDTQTLANALPRPTHVALDDTHVYVGTAASKESDSDGVVLRVPRAGGSPELLARAPGGVSGLVVTADAVLWTNWGTRAPTGVRRPDGYVSKLTKDEREPALVVVGQQEPFRLRLVKGALMWLARGTDQGRYRDGALLRLPLQGGSVESVATGLHSVTDWAPVAGEFALGLAERPQASLGGALLGATRGSPARVLGVTAGIPTFIEAVGDNVCWVERGNLSKKSTRLLCKPAKSSAPATSLIDPRELLSSFTATDDYLYLVSVTEGNILRMERRKMRDVIVLR